MERFIIASNHLVLLESPFPVSGFMVVNGEEIEHVEICPKGVSMESLSALYPNTLLLNYLDFYISPGIIDLNSRKEWESYSTYTKSAISGGVTFLLEEPSFYSNSSNVQDLFCDIGQVQVLNDNNYEDFDESYFAFKLYLFPPSGSIESIKNLSMISYISEFSDRPIFIDPNTPDERMLFISSPLRHKGADEHVQTSTETHFNIFAGAYGEDIDVDSGNSGSEERKVTQVATMIDGKIGFFDDDIEVVERKESIGGDEVIVTPETKELKPIRKSFKRKHKPLVQSKTILEDLEQRIKKESQNYEVLCKAENQTYSNSGSTSYFYSDEPISIPKIQPVNIPRQLQRMRPAKINTTILQQDRTNNYDYYLANCPEHWETKGIDTLLSAIPASAKVHIQGISSAVAISKVRKATECFKQLTCEIPASHLFFSSNSIEKSNTRFKSVPPIRNAANLNFLWDMVKLRGIPAITSQHVFIDGPHKALESGSFRNALNGICSIGLSLQAIWTALNMPITPIEKLEGYLVRISRWLSTQPAKIIGLNNRGSINKGKLADFIVWEPYCKQKAQMSKEYKTVSPYSDIELCGKIHCVYLRGKVAYNNGIFQEFGKKVYPNN